MKLLKILKGRQKTKKRGDIWGVARYCWVPSHVHKTNIFLLDAVHDCVVWSSVLTADTMGFHERSGTMVTLLQLPKTVISSPSGQHP